MIKVRKYHVDSSFENSYFNARSVEHRILSLEEIKQLPLLKDHPLAQEWKYRVNSTKRLLNYISKRQPNNILDLGCGNGWLTSKISKIARQVHGVDVNIRELEQAAQLLNGTSNTQLSYVNILEDSLQDQFDFVIINGSIQYFSDTKVLMKRLKNMIAPNGEVHIVDSPFYDESKKTSAKERSDSYYMSIGFPEMATYYYHHSWQELNEFDTTIAFNPNSIRNKIMRKIGVKESPFPWIIVKNL